MHRELWLSLALSGALHVATMLMMEILAPEFTIDPDVAAPRLNASIRPMAVQSIAAPVSARAPETTKPATARPRESASEIAGARHGGERESRSANSPARFLTPPRFAAIESYPIPVSFRLTARLYVNRLGLVERVDLLNYGAMPAALLEELRTELLDARLTPALRNGTPDASTLEIVVGAN